MDGRRAHALADATLGKGLTGALLVGKDEGLVTLGQLPEDRLQPRHLFDVIHQVEFLWVKGCDG